MIYCPDPDKPAWGRLARLAGLALVGGAILGVWLGLFALLAVFIHSV